MTYCATMKWFLPILWFVWCGIPNGPAPIMILKRADAKNGRTVPCNALRFLYQLDPADRCNSSTRLGVWIDSASESLISAKSSM